MAEVKFFTSNTSLVSAVNYMAKSFFPLKFSFYINLDNKERARSERQITTETNFVGRET